MKSLGQLQEIVTNAFKSLEYPARPVELYEPANYTISLGGKRIRPLMLILACDTWSGKPEDAINTAIGIELFHNFTLVHDDIMDNAPLRRGKETVYKKWNPNVAILSGDAMFALAVEYIARDNNSDIIRIFARTAREVCEGQQYDMNFESRENVGLSEYLEMIRLKTAVLLACSLQIGALKGGANNVEAAKLYDLGINLGLSFQIKDDYLDAFGDENLFGKKTGGDIQARKKTFLYLKAIEVANVAQRKELEKLYRLPQQNNEEVKSKIIGLYLELGIKEIAGVEMERYFRISGNIIETLNIPEEKKLRFSELAGLVLNRNY